MRLYRPIGEKEYQLVKEGGFKSIPPRLPEQPIFYPVLSREYAVEIASQWNTTDKNSGYNGYVLAFSVDDDFISRYPVQTVGAARHQELWVPTEELEEFNRHIKGLIEETEI